MFYGPEYGAAMHRAVLGQGRHGLGWEGISGLPQASQNLGFLFLSLLGLCVDLLDIPWPCTC
ncbi:Hypothetical protein FKW44_024114 [Caligus rogercresseyi]|uniref:Uncharacterized protein n=1 Tax=Caligus rogercresseyi TaxID=217165 RepID=A0A7T8GLL6_CALRO|nr:Hypothetical protein FKW44_024114 [Caligus rogercresseyi]